MGIGNGKGKETKNFGSILCLRVWAGCVGGFCGKKGWNGMVGIGWLRRRETRL